MTPLNHTPHSVSGIRNPIGQAGCGLRSDLAAFYSLAVREPAPRRRPVEVGVLAELRRLRGSD